VCVDGCRKSGGNGCAEGFHCDVEEDGAAGAIGQCVQDGDEPDGAGGTDGTEAEATPGAKPSEIVLAGGGCKCSLADQNKKENSGLAAFGAALGALLLRARRRGERRDGVR
jgi:hypothetical protein